MDVPQPHNRDIPEQENERKKDQAGDDQQSDENSFLGPIFHCNLIRNQVRSNLVRSSKTITPNSKKRGAILNEAKDL
jgi:hypothetical protein